MISKYKVIKPFGVLKAGDILTLDNDMYVFTDEKASDSENYYSQVNVAMSSNMVEDYAKSGLIEAVACEYKTDDKIVKLRNLIAQLKNTYNQRKRNIEKKYNDGKIQTCVKVEHDTVYFNMMKLLNKFEAIINE